MAGIQLFILELRSMKQRSPPLEIAPRRCRAQHRPIPAQHAQSSSIDFILSYGQRRAACVVDPACIEQKFNAGGRISMGSSPQSGSANIPVDIDISIRLKPEV